MFLIERGSRMITIPAFVFGPGEGMNEPHMPAHWSGGSGMAGSHPPLCRIMLVKRANMMRKLKLRFQETRADQCRDDVGSSVHWLRPT